MSESSNLVRQTVLSRRAEENLSDIELLHRIGVTLIDEQDRFELYGKIVEACKVDRTFFADTIRACSLNRVHQQAGRRLNRLKPDHHF